MEREHQSAKGESNDLRSQAEDLQKAKTNLEKKLRHTEEQLADITSKVCGGGMGVWWEGVWGWDGGVVGGGGSASMHNDCTPVQLCDYHRPSPLPFSYSSLPPSLLQFQEQSAELSHLSSTHSKSESENASLNQQVEEAESKCHALERQQKDLQQQLEEARAELEATAAVSGDASLGWMLECGADMDCLQCNEGCAHACMHACVCARMHMR